MTASCCVWNCTSIHERLCYSIGLFNPNSQASQSPKGTGFLWLHSTGSPEVPRHVRITCPWTHVNCNQNLIFTCLFYFTFKLNLLAIEISEKCESWTWEVFGQVGALMAGEGELGAAWLMFFWSDLSSKACGALLQHPLQTAIWLQPGLKHQWNRIRRSERCCLAQLLLRCLKYTPC